MLNDAIVANQSFLRCVHVAPNSELYGPPGRFARHFTGVGANKEAMFFERWPSAAVDALLHSFPTWNATACATELRSVPMPADFSNAEEIIHVSVELTRHCLDEHMASGVLRGRLWPAIRRRVRLRR
ncbi:hypothetical protein OAO87_02270 [bacterium]|nr:hypothetical protein [bacterium]